MLPSLDAAAVPVTPRELTVGPQRRRNVTGLPMLQLVAVPRVRVPPRKGAGRHVDPSLARELERLDYSAWLAVGKALASLTDKVIERGRAAGVRVPVWKPTSELGMGTSSRRWRRISTSSSRCSCGDDVALMEWDVRNLISTQRQTCRARSSR